jgi:hypothetical protein
MSYIGVSLAAIFSSSGSPSIFNSTLHYEVIGGGGGGGYAHGGGGGDDYVQLHVRRHADAYSNVGGYCDIFKYKML